MTKGLPPHGRVGDASAVSPVKGGPAREPYYLYAVHDWTREGTEGFLGHPTMPGADVWRSSETSRGLDPDGWLVRRIEADATGM